MRSKLARRNRVRRSAGAAGARFASSNLARRNASIGERGQAVFLTFGGSTRLKGWKDQ